MNWLLDNVPLWGWAIPAGVALFFAWRYLGFKGMIAALGAIGAGWLYRSGRKSGASDARQKQKKADEKAVKDHERIEAETDRMSDAELDNANARWLRKRER